LPKFLFGKIGQNHSFSHFCSTYFTVEQILLHFCSVLYLKDNGVLRILSPKGASHTNSDSEWGNESFVQQISTLNKCDAIFGNYFGFHEPKQIHTVLKFDILRLPIHTLSLLSFVLP
jgi:hypothetical protein